MWNSKYSSGLGSHSVCVVSLILGHCELLKLKFIPKTTSFQPPQILLQIIVDKPQKDILTWHNQLKVLQTFDSNGQFANWFPNQPSQPKWAPIGPCHFFQLEAAAHYEIIAASQFFLSKVQFLPLCSSPQFVLLPPLENTSGCSSPIPDPYSILNPSFVPLLAAISPLDKFHTWTIYKSSSHPIRS